VAFNLVSIYILLYASSKYHLFGAPNSPCLPPHLSLHPSHPFSPFHPLCPYSAQISRLTYPTQTSDDPTVPMRYTTDPCPYTTYTTFLHDEYYTKHSTLEVDKIVCNVCLFIGMCTLVFSVSTKKMYKLKYVQYLKREFRYPGYHLGGVLWFSHT
jgi:hypothetical protein